VVNTSRAAIFPPGGSLALSTPYAFSCIWKYNGTNTLSPSFIIDASKGNPETSGGNAFSAFTQTNIPLGNGWTYSKLEFTLSTSPTLGAYLTYGIGTGSDSSYLNNTFDVYNEQFEQNLYATPYVNGTRSNTQAILDLTGNNTVTATSLTYASDGTFSFDGSNSYITLGNDTSLLSGNATTVEAWVKTNVTGGYKKIFTNGNATGIYLSIGPSPYNTYFGVVTNGTSGGATWTNNISTTNYTHLVGTYNGSTCILYANGLQVATGAASGTMGTGATVYVSGYASGGERWNGNIDGIKVYNRALSAAEVTQNFEASRSRYRI
jgi:hypothetical protein